MKKLLVLIAFLGLTLSMSAKPKAVGLRLGYLGGDVSYQHSLNEKSFLEGTVGFNPWYGFGVRSSVTYNYVLLQPKWTEKGDWALYVGAGIGGGFGFRTKSYHVAVVPQLGLEYKFDNLPLQLSADIRPSIGMSGSGKNIGFYMNYFAFIPTLSVRYAF